MRRCPVCAKDYEGDRTSCPEDGAVLLLHSSSEDLVGRTLRESYRVDGVLGQGGMGTVYRGVQLALSRPVAIKTIRPGIERSQLGVQRFLRESKALSHINHPNVVQVYDAGNTEDGVFYLVMELLDGITLRDAVPRDRGLAPEQALGMMEGICHGVAAIHRAGLIHRDLKPANVMCMPGPEDEHLVKVLDFGLARLIDPDPGTSQNQAITQSGILMGSPGYAAPEQITNDREIDARADVYALGALFRFMLSGTDAYRGNSAAKIMLQQVAGPPEPLQVVAGLDQRALRRVNTEIMRAMAAPEDRHQEVADFLAAIRRALTGRSRTLSMTTAAVSDPETLADGDLDHATVPEQLASSPARPRWQLAGGLATFGIAAALAWWASGAGKSAEPPPVAKAAAPLPPAPRPIVRMGMSAAFSGPSEALGQSMHAGLAARFTAANTDKELPFDIELIKLDDGYEPDRAAANMRELEQKNVVAVVGNVGTPTAEKTVPLANELRLPMIGAFTGAPLLRKQPPDRYIFNYRAGYRSETAAIVRYYLQRKGYKAQQIAIFAQDDSYGRAGIEGVERGLRELGHSDHPLLTTYQRNTADVGRAVRTITKHRRKIKAIIMISSYRAAALFVKELRDRRYRGDFASVSFVGADALANELRVVGVGPSERILVTQVVPPPTSSASAVTRYRELMKAADREQNIGFVSLEGFIVGELAVRALAQCPAPVSSECIVDSLEAMHSLETGYGTAWSFGPADHDASEQIWATLIHPGGGFEEFDLD